MTKTYRLSSETVQQLSKIEGDTRNINLAFYASLLLLHLTISALIFLADYFILSLFINIGLGLLILLGYFYARGKDYYERYYASYRLELSEVSISLTQLNRRPVEIRNNDILRIRELLPEGEMYILARNKNKVIDVYSLVLKENPELQEALTNRKTPEATSVVATKLVGPIIALLLTFVAVFFCFRAFQFPNFLVFGLMCLGIWVAGLYKVSKWPVIDPKIKKLMWIGIVPGIFCALLSIAGIIWIIFVTFGTLFG